jgi:diguanylate cyclase (GGDEF)-like protein
VGDKVLKSVAHFLKQRLRASDIIGRYGGEEFAVILLDTEEPGDAGALMDTIRAAFAEIDHFDGNESFRVTFSCGVATFPEFATAHSITDAADKALYEAKRTGRNRVVLASADDLL